MSFRFMRFVLRMKKIGVTMAIHAMLVSSVVGRLPRIKPLVSITVCGKGRKVVAKVCMAGGSEASGKKVPLSRNMGVM